MVKKLETVVKESLSGELNKRDWSKWQHNLISFLVPLGVMYVTQLIGTFGLEDNIVEWQDAVPNKYTQGAMILYVLNGALDILNKYKAGATK